MKDLHQRQMISSIEFVFYESKWKGLPPKIKGIIVCIELDDETTLKMLEGSCIE